LWPTAKAQQESRIADSRARAEAAEESERHRGRSQRTENPQIEFKAEGVKAKDRANESERRIMQRAKELEATQTKEIGTREECPKTPKEKTEDRAATSLKVGGWRPSSTSLWDASPREQSWGTSLLRVSLPAGCVLACGTRRCEAPLRGYSLRCS